MIYTFLNTETQKIEEHSMRMSEYDEFKEKNPHLDRYHEPGRGPAIGDSVRLGIRRPDTGFKEVLSKVAEAHPTSEVGQRYGKKSIKEVKTREIVKKHVEKMKRV